MRRLVLVVYLAGLLTLAASAEAPEPNGYRLDNYDDIVPDTLAGATVVDAQEVVRLRDQSGAVLIDVIPQQRRPESLPENQLWIPAAHQTIPGALWLPGVGYGQLSKTIYDYFLYHLDAASQGDKAKPLVFFCRDNCWMSWNAAKRALSHDYTNVYWYPEGTEGWFEAGFDYAPAVPAPDQR